MKESSKFYSSLGLLIILNVIIKPLWIFGIDRQVQNAVGTTTYGAYFSLLNFSVVFSFLLDWGLTPFFNRQLAASGENFISKAGSFLFTKLLFSILYAVIVFAVAYLSGVRNWDILLSVVIIQTLTSLFVFLRSIVTAQQWFSTDAWLSVLDKGLMILVCGSFLWSPAVGGNMTIEKFLWVQISCTAIAVMTVLIVLFKKGKGFSFQASSLWNRGLFRSALPFAIIVLLMSVHYRLDGFLLERIHPNGAHEAGLYAGAYRLLDAANMIGYLLASFLLPFITRQWSQEKKIAGVILNSRHLLLLFSVVVIVTTFFLASWIQQTLYHNTDESAVTVLQWCLPALVGYALTQVYGTVLTAIGHVVQFSYIVLLSVILNIVLNLVLIPSWGAKGCCMAALASEAFCGITAMIWVQKKSGINIHFRSLLMYIFIAALLCGFYWLGMNWAVNKWILMMGAGLITIAATIALKIVDIKKLQNIIKGNHNL